MASNHTIKGMYFDIPERVFSLKGRHRVPIDLRIKYIGGLIYIMEHCILYTYVSVPGWCVFQCTQFEKGIFLTEV